MIAVDIADDLNAQDQKGLVWRSAMGPRGVRLVDSDQPLGRLTSAHPRPRRIGGGPSAGEIGAAPRTAAESSWVSVVPVFVPVASHGPPPHPGSDHPGQLRRRRILPSGNGLTSPLAPTAADWRSCWKAHLSGMSTPQDTALTLRGTAQAVSSTYFVNWFSSPLGPTRSTPCSLA